MEMLTVILLLLIAGIGQSRPAASVPETPGRGIAGKARRAGGPEGQGRAAGALWRGSPWASYFCRRRGLIP